MSAFSWNARNQVTTLNGVALQYDALRRRTKNAAGHSYDHFGNTTVSGSVTSNPSQYTGRENEGNGLYFYRARYYSPVLHRFISEDPLGFGGGAANFYVYVGDSPTSFTDPTGLSRKDTLHWWDAFWHAFWYESPGPHLHGCALQAHEPLPGSELLCDENGNPAGEAPGAISKYRKIKILVPAEALIPLKLATA